VNAFGKVSRVRQHLHNKTQKQIADAAGVTEVTVRNRFKQLSNGLSLSRLIKEAKKASSALPLSV